MCHWSVPFLETHQDVIVGKSKQLLALSAGAILILLYLPGHPPYYELPASIAAKTYSNSMMAFLNSRIKPVSNTPSFETPVWNESVGRVSATVGDEGIIFRGESEMELSAAGNPLTVP